MYNFPDLIKLDIYINPAMIVTVSKQEDKIFIKTVEGGIVVITEKELKEGITLDDFYSFVVAQIEAYNQKPLNIFCYDGSLKFDDWQIVGSSRIYYKSSALKNENGEREA